MFSKPAKWDQWAIRAELHRRGLRFVSMAEESGVSASTLRAALVKPSLRANRFIADRLSIQIHELWPDWFYSDGELIPLKHRKRLSRQRQLAASQSSRVAGDAGEPQ